MMNKFKVISKFQVQEEFNNSVLYRYLNPSNLTMLVVTVTVSLSTDLCPNLSPSSIASNIAGNSFSLNSGVQGGDIAGN